MSETWSCPDCGAEQSGMQMRNLCPQCNLKPENMRQTLGRIVEGTVKADHAMSRGNRALVGAYLEGIQDNAKELLEALETPIAVDSAGTIWTADNEGPIPLFGWERFHQDGVEARATAQPGEEKP